MTSNSNPFRQEAIDAKKNQALSDILVVRPVSFLVVTIIIFGVLCALVCILCLGTYSKRVSVSGYLRPIGGFLKVYPPQSGVLTARLAADGSQVATGQLLFHFTSERRFRNQQNLQLAVSEQAAMRVKLLQREKLATLDLERQTNANLRQKIRQLELQKTMIESQIEGQRGSLQIAEENLKRYQGLLEQHYVSRELLQQKLLEVFNHKDKLRVLDRQVIEISQALADTVSEIRSLALRTTSQVSQLDRGLSNAAQELLESDGKTEFSIAAPQAGILNNITVELGQQVDTSKAIANLIPEGSKLIAELFATGRSIGLVRERDQVMLRMHAFPYQKFGHVAARIVTISSIPSPVSDLSLPFKPTIGGAVISDEPVYRITAELSRETLSGEKQDYQLKPGLLFDAEIFQEERRLWEWVLAPLKGLRTNVTKE